MYKRFLLIIALTVLAGWIALPRELPVSFNIFGQNISFTLGSPVIQTVIFDKPIYKIFELKQGLDIQGGTQVVLDVKMDEVAEEDRKTALDSAKEVIARRVDLYGIAEPKIQTAQQGDDYRIIVELAGVDDSNEALRLIGNTAKLEFKLLAEEPDPAATESAMAFLEQFESVGLSGAEVKRATVQFDEQGQPVVGLEFSNDGKKRFAEVTTDNVGRTLGIFLDEMPIMLPTIQTAIPDGQAVITGGFSLDEAKNLSIQLNAGALPVSIEVLEQRNIGASLGQQSVNDSVRAGLIGLSLVMVFMFLNYGQKGLVANLALTVYAILTIALYKILGVVLTLPGIAGLLLSIGMAVDANILIFERMKEELRKGRDKDEALELGFGRAWDSIKDANIATLATALILINPFDFSFLNSSGLVRGFGITLFLGVLLSLFTGVVVTRTFMRVFLLGGKQS